MEKEFEVECTEEYRKTIIVKGSSVDDAFDKAQEMQIDMKDAHYVEGSFEISRVGPVHSKQASASEEEEERKGKKLSGVVLTDTNEWVSTFSDQTMDEVIAELQEKEGEFDGVSEFVIFETKGRSTNFTKEAVCLDS